MNKNVVVIDNVQFIVDGMSYEYAQQDGDSAGRSDDGTMTRDVIGLTNKVYCLFNSKDRWYGSELSKLLKLLKKKECTFGYFDPKENSRLTKQMYVVSDKCECTLVENEIYLKSPLEIRFIQMDVDII
jgi:hypothetical protein